MPNNDEHRHYKAKSTYFQPIYRDGERSFPSHEAMCTHALACAIIEQAVYDWIALDYGYWDRVKVKNDMVFNIQTRKFFQSKWFEYLLSFALPEIEPETVRRQLRIPEPEEMGGYA